MSIKPPFNLYDSEYQYWKPISIDGSECKFDHLKVVRHRYVRFEGKEEYTFYITFSHHVFSTSCEKFPVTTKDYLYTAKPQDKRMFCPDRYKLSFMLPKIIEDLPERFCYHGGYGKYCTCEYEDEAGNKRYYQIVFAVFKSKKKLRLHVQSAYPLDKDPGRKKKVNFWYVCYNLLHGKKLPKPHRK